MIYLVLLLAAFLRLYDLDSLPISLFGDEIDVGYHAWALISTGKDYLGNVFPTYIQSLAEWRTPLLSYFIAPFIGLLGPNPFALRLPVALLGVLNVYLIYLLTNRLFNNKTLPVFGSKIKLATISALILAITPWHLHLSRIAIDSTLLLSLLLSGTYFFLRALNSEKFYILSAICFSLTFYTYATANIFTPLLLLSLLVIYKKKITLKKTYKALIVAFIVCLPIGYHLLFGQAAGRFNSISLFADKEITYQIINQRVQPWVKSPLIERLFENKVTAYSTAWLNNYLTAFSPQFLFISGDPNYRHSINTHGELLLITLPLLLFGLFFLFKNFKQKENKLLFIWLLLSVLPSSLTRDGAAHVIRLSLMIPTLTIISALGLYHLLNLFKVKCKNIIFTIIILISFLNLSSYWYSYSTHYRFLSARHWHYGYQEIMEDLKPYLADANNVYINNTYEPSLLRFAFFTGFPPEKFQRDFISDTLSGEQINAHFTSFPLGEKYHFGRIDSYQNILQLLEEGDIYLVVQGEEIPGDWDWSQNPPEGIKVLSMVKDVLGRPLFYLLTLE